MLNQFHLGFLVKLKLTTHIASWGFSGGVLGLGVVVWWFGCWGVVSGLYVRTLILNLLIKILTMLF